MTHRERGDTPRGSNRLTPRAGVVLAAMVAGMGLTTTASVHAQFIPRPVPVDTSRAAPDTLAEDTTVYELEALRVRTTRPLATQAGATAVRLNLDAPRVFAAPILDEALRRMPFFQVRENSRGEAQLTLRGTESRQVAVLVDGIPLTLGWDARTDLSLIPVGAAREIQMYRGLSSVLHGPNVLGGVVEIDIVRGTSGVPAPPPLRTQLGIDGTGAAAVAAEAGKRIATGANDLTVRGGLAFRTRDGVALASGVDQPVPDHDLRLNSDRQHFNGFLAARYGSSEGGPWIALSSFGFTADKGVPPELHIENPRLWRIPETSRVVTGLSGGTGWGATPLGEGDLEASFGVDWGNSRIEEYETLAYQTVAQEELSDDRTITARLVGDHTLADGTVRAAFTWADTRHVETLDPGGESRFRQQLWSLAAEAEQPLGRQSEDTGPFSDLTLTAGLSLDRASTPETGGREASDPLVDWGARVGASALVAGGTTRLHAGVSRRVRFPSLRELYSGALGRFIPNPNLDPEVLVAGELGVTGELEGVDGQVVLFHQRWSDAIVRSSVGDGMFRRENRNRVTATGVELLASLRLGASHLGGDLTLQGVALRDELAPQTEREPEYQPEVFGNLELSGPLALGVWGSAALGYVGPQYCVNPELEADQRLDASGRLDLMLGREWRLGGALSTLQTSLALDNLTDAAVFDQCGLPQPGRTLRLQVRVR